MPLVYSWVLAATVSTLVVVVNAFVLGIILKTDRLKSRQNCVIIHMTVVDLIQGVVLFAISCTVLSTRVLEKMSVFGGCPALGFLWIWTDTLACTSVAVFFIDRLVYTQSAVNYTHRKTRKFLVVIMSYVAFHGFMAAILPILGWGKYVFRLGIVCDVDWRSKSGYPPFLVVWCILVPITVTSGCFIQLALTVRKKCKKIRLYKELQQDILRPIGARLAVCKYGITGREKAFIKTLALCGSMLAVYLFSWIFNLSVWIGQITGMISENVVAVVFLTTVAMTTSVANPLLIAIYNPQLRGAAAWILTCGRAAIELKLEDDISPSPVAVLDNSSITRTSSFIANSWNLTSLCWHSYAVKMPVEAVAWTCTRQQVIFSRFQPVNLGLYMYAYE